MIHRELCKRLKFDLSTKRYTHKAESVRENETHKILWDFEIQTVRRPDLVLINKKNKRTCHLVNFAVPADHRVEMKESENIENTKTFLES